MRTPKSVWTNPLHFCAFGFGFGAIYPAPGTWGTLMGVILYWMLPAMTAMNYLIITAAVALVGIGLCGKTAKDIQVHDHSGIVWDEISGFFITMIAVPKTIVWVLVGFILFRLFDIAKPWPISWVDKQVGAGLGIMLDDWLAAIYALLLMQFFVWVWS